MDKIFQEAQELMDMILANESKGVEPNDDEYMLLDEEVEFDSGVLEFNETASGAILAKHGKPAVMLYKKLLAKVKDNPKKGVKFVDGKPKIYTRTPDEIKASKARGRKMKGKKKKVTNKASANKKRMKTKQRLGESELLDATSEIELLNDMIQETKGDINSDLHNVLESKVVRIKEILSEALKGETIEVKLESKIARIKEILVEAQKSDTVEVKLENKVNRIKEILSSL